MKKNEETIELKDNTARSGKKRITSKQVVAIIGIVLLLLMYLAALIAAITDNSASGRLFFVCLYATIVIPLLIWIYTWMYGKLTGKRTFTDPVSLQESTEEDPKPGN